MLRRLEGTGILKAPTLRDMHRVHWIDPDFTNSYGIGSIVDSLLYPLPGSNLHFYLIQARK